MTLTDPIGPSELAQIPSVPEARLSAGEAARLPPAPPAPWQSHVEATLWWHVASARANSFLPPALAQRAALPITIGGLIHYLDSPVGPYREIFGSPLMLRGGLLLVHIPFMAVDSAASVAGGRRNWALPKVTARFHGPPGDAGHVEAVGQGWAISVRTRTRRRRLPAAGAVTVAQLAPDGRIRRFTARMNGTIALGSVEVEHSRPSGLASWLTPGRHGALVLSGTQVTLPVRP